MSSIELTRDGAVLQIKINKPKANAIGIQESRDLASAFNQLETDETLRVAILTGAGPRIFSAGMDLREAAELGIHDGADIDLPGGFAGLKALMKCVKPVIAAVNGLAIGGGFELVLGCDIVVGVDTAEFSLPETQVGVIADGGGVQWLARRIPRNVALDLLLTGRPLPAAEALRLGLVTSIADTASLLPTAHDYASKIVDGAPLSIAAIKEVMRGTEMMNEYEAYEATESRRFPIHRAMLSSEDHEEGPRAFMEKRKPVWKGR